MSEHTELENHIELGWWGVFDWDEHIATFKLKDDARRWMAWNNATHDRLCIRKVSVMCKWVKFEDGDLKENPLTPSTI